MIRRFYVHNYRCLENFELPISGQSSVLLIGKNGAGKTSIGMALQILQKIARGTNRVGDLVQAKDVARGRSDVPMRFEIEVALNDAIYSYALAFEYPKQFKELRVYEEALSVDGKPVYTREIAQVRLTREEADFDSKFRLDWHLVALPIIQRQSPDDPLYLFKQWLANALILRPLPTLMQGTSDHETTQPDQHGTELGAWFSGLLVHTPAAYSTIDAYLKEVMPDLVDVKNAAAGKDARNLTVQFSSPIDRKVERTSIAFDDLSDGEKCFMIYALTIAANEAYGPLLCFWDEPDNYLAPSEVGPSLVALRRAFKSDGQLIVTSHNPEAIRRFSDENTVFLDRRSHLEPTTARKLQAVRESGEFSGDFVEALLRGDVGA
jgi:predicted ATPase